MFATLRSLLPPKKSMFAVFLLIAVLSVIFVLVKQPNKKSPIATKKISPTSASISQSAIAVPEGWEQVTSSSSNVSLLFLKKVEAGQRPSVSLIKDQFDPTMRTPQQEVEAIMVNTMPLTEIPTVSTKDRYVREFAGSYTEGNAEVFVKLKIIIRGTTMYIINASYQDVSDEEDVTTLMDSIYNTQI